MTTKAQRLAEELEHMDHERWDVLDRAAALLRRQEEEIQEQCRLNGMGAEREARLLARIAEQKAALMQAREALIFAGNIWHMNCPKDSAIAALNELLGEQT